MTPTQIEATYPPEVVAAWHWLDTNCRHYATPNSDQQTVSNLSPSDLVTGTSGHCKHTTTRRRRAWRGCSRPRSPTASRRCPAPGGQSALLPDRRTASDTRPRD